MIEQAWTAEANDADRHLAVLEGEVFVGASWAFGRVVNMNEGAFAVPQMAGGTLASPRLASGAFGTPTMANGSWEN